MEDEKNDREKMVELGGWKKRVRKRRNAKLNKRREERVEGGE